MKAVILAGGFGTRLSEETILKPKPMIEIGERPILWHIMKTYSSFGVNEFVICLGYKGYLIKEYFFNYYKHLSDFTIDLSNNELKIHNSYSEPWKVTLVDTGESVMTGGRLKRIKKYVENDEYFAMTYGDGVADVDIRKLEAFHRSHNKLATMTTVKPPGRFGTLVMGEGNQVKAFKEKPDTDGSQINGGFFILSPKCIDLVENDSISWEKEPLENLANTGNLISFDHKGFWQCMDTVRDKKHLEDLWFSGKAPWKLWND